MSFKKGDRIEFISETFKHHLGKRGTITQPDYGVTYIVLKFDNENEELIFRPERVRKLTGEQLYLL